VADESTALIPYDENSALIANEPAPGTALEKSGTKKPARKPDPLDRFVARRRAQAILALKLEGRKPREIAAELDIPVKSVYWALYQMRRGGHLKAQQEISDAIEHAIKPLVIERLEERLDDPLVDQDLLIEAAKGVGIFQNHSRVKSEGPHIQAALVVKFELPEGQDAVSTAVGEVHGKALEGEVVPT
jgi:DNA-binding CsgD family transcriptional regulator